MLYPTQELTQFQALRDRCQTLPECHSIAHNSDDRAEGVLRLPFKREKFLVEVRASSKNQLLTFDF